MILNQHKIIFPTVYKMTNFRKNHVNVKKCWRQQKNYFHLRLPQIFKFLLVAEHICRVSCLQVNFAVSWWYFTLAALTTITAGKRTWFIFHHGKSFTEMQLFYIIDILGDNYNVVHDCFETDSVNVMKKWPLVAKKHIGNFNIY